MIIIAFNQQPGEWNKYERGIQKKHELEYPIPCRVVTGFKENVYRTPGTNNC